jgi:hypothetical protein
MIFWAADVIRDFASLDESHKEDLGGLQGQMSRETLLFQVE